MNCIYALIDPDTHSVRYVGLTKRLKERLNAHRNNSGSTPVAQWSRQLKKEGKRFGHIILDEGLPCAETNAREIFWMDFFKIAGNELLNVQRGGKGIWSDDNRSSTSVDGQNGYSVSESLVSRGRLKP